MKRKRKPPMVFLLGPTGAGKSEFAARLAKKIHAEIISCDSMQAYKGMRVVSQQPKAALLRKVPHHLVGTLKPSQTGSAADFAERARKVAGDIVARGRVPLVVGGTGLYARALLKGLFPSPPANESLRKKLYRQAQARGRKFLYRKLAKVDPASAAKVHPHDTRRVVRALEVYELTGKPISEWRKNTKGIADKYSTKVFILNRPRSELYKRIDKRVEEMFKAGAVQEVKKLRKGKMSRTAKAALGFNEISGYLKGNYGLDVAKELLKKNTRHYAKRQITWFRSEKGAAWLDLGNKKREKLAIQRIERIAKKRDRH